MAQDLKILTSEEIMQMDQLQLVEAHVSIVEDSVDAESIRTSAVALLNTEAGRSYVAFNPIAI